MLGDNNNHPALQIQLKVCTPSMDPVCKTIPVYLWLTFAHNLPSAWAHKLPNTLTGLSLSLQSLYSSPRIHCAHVHWNLKDSNKIILPFISLVKIENVGGLGLLMKSCQTTEEAIWTAVTLHAENIHVLEALRIVFAPCDFHMIVALPRGKF